MGIRPLVKTANRITQDQVNCFLYLVYKSSTNQSSSLISLISSFHFRTKKKASAVFPTLFPSNDFLVFRPTGIDQLTLIESAAATPAKWMLDGTGNGG